MAVVRLPEPLYRDEWADVSFVPLPIRKLIEMRLDLLTLMNGRYPPILAALLWDPQRSSISIDPEDEASTRGASARFITNDDVFAAPQTVSYWASDRRTANLNDLRSTNMVMVCTRVRRVMTERDVIPFSVCIDTAPLGYVANEEKDLVSIIKKDLARVFNGKTAGFRLIPPTWAVRREKAAAGVATVDWGAYAVGKMWDAEHFRAVDSLLFHLSLLTLVLHIDAVDVGTITPARGDVALVDLTDRDIEACYRFFGLIASLQAGWWSVLTSTIVSALTGNHVFDHIEKLFEAEGTSFKNKGSAVGHTRDLCSRVACYTPDMEEIISHFHGVGLTTEAARVTNRIGPMSTEAIDGPVVKTECPPLFVVPEEYIAEKEFTREEYFDLVRESLGASNYHDPAGFAARMVGTTRAEWHANTYSAAGWIVQFNEMLTGAVPNLTNSPAWRESYLTVARPLSAFGGSTPYVPMHRDRRQAVVVSRTTNDHGQDDIIGLTTSPCIYQPDSVRRMNIGRRNITPHSRVAVEVYVPVHVTVAKGGAGLMPELWRLLPAEMDLGENSTAAARNYMDVVDHFGRTRRASESAPVVLLELVNAYADVMTENGIPVTVIDSDKATLPQVLNASRVETASWHHAISEEGEIMLYPSHPHAMTPAQKKKQKTDILLPEHADSRLYAGLTGIGSGIFLSDLAAGASMHEPTALMRALGEALNTSKVKRVLDQLTCPFLRHFLSFSKNDKAGGWECDQDAIPFYRTAGFSTAWVGENERLIQLMQDEKSSQPIVVDSARTGSVIMSGTEIVLVTKGRAVFTYMRDKPLRMLHNYQAGYDITSEGLTWQRFAIPSLYRGWVLNVSMRRGLVPSSIVGDSGEYTINRVEPYLDGCHLRVLANYARALIDRASGPGAGRGALRLPLIAATQVKQS